MFNRKQLIIGALFIATILQYSCQPLDLFCPDCLDFEYDNDKRKYLLYVPENLPQNAPLVFALHGYTGRAQGVDEMLNMNNIAAQNGFVVCYPQGARDRNSITHWNARLDISNKDDIGFLSALAMSLQEEYGLDTARTYTCGISNGGFMSYTLVAEAPHVFKGAASIIGTMSGYTWENRNICSPAPILQVSGTNDNVVPYDGTMSTDGGWGGAPHIYEVMAFWSELNQTMPADTVTISDVSTAYYFNDTVNSNDVWYYEVAGMAHEVPTGGNKGFSSGELIWQFFSQL